MNKCLCVNPDKEEYLDFGSFDENASVYSAAGHTIEYFMATEWRGDRVIFIFQNSGKSNIFPLEDDAYEYVVNMYSERSVLNKVPQYTYFVNFDRKEYYFKNALPQGRDLSRLNPLPFVLSEAGTNAFNDYELSEKEENDIGRWLGGNVVITNNCKVCKGLRLYESPFCQSKNGGRVLNGLNIVVTGTISGYSRNDMEQLIKRYGGNPQKSVTRSTSFVVVADYKPGTKKINDAKKYGIKIISEKKFFEMLGE